MIWSVSDLQNNFSEIEHTVHETAKPLFLMKNGHCDMVLLSMEAFEALRLENEVHSKLQAAEREADMTGHRYSHEDVLKAVQTAIGGKE